MSKVAIVECYNYKDAKVSIKKCLNLLGGIQKFVKKGDSVLIKPNLCDPMHPDTAAVTHPMFVKAVVQLVKEAGGNPWIGEQSAGGQEGITLKSFEISGIKKVAEEENIKLIDLSQDKFVESKINSTTPVKIARSVLDADVIINLPKMKTHGLAFITAAVKNLFGCLHYSCRKRMHRLPRKEFCNFLAALYGTIKPQINILDMIISMEGDGPSGGHPINTNIVMASTNGYDLDEVAARITNHKLLATNKKIEIVGKHSAVIKDFKPHKAYTSQLDNIIIKINRNNCKSCDACRVSCPVGAISSNFSIDYTKCIRCLCCSEVCPHLAVEILHPKTGTIRLGRNCNQNCLFCTTALDNYDELSLNEIKSRISLMLKEGVTDLTLTGGEPTVRKDLIEIIVYAKKQGILTIELQTNGVLMNKPLLLLLKKAGLTSLLVSLHSHKPDISNKLTQSKSFRNTVRCIKLAAAENMVVIVSCVINNENYKELTEFVKFVDSISKKIMFYFSFIRPNGSTVNNKYLVPKIIDIEFYVYKLINYCKMNKLNFKIEGLPLCYLGDFKKYSAEINRMLRKPQIYVDGTTKHDSLHDYINSNLKLKADCCKVCRFYNSCPGLWVEYAKMYGVGELFPILE